jgi:hypothetical protein
MLKTGKAVVAKAARLAKELRYTLGAGKVPVAGFDLSNVEGAALFFEEHGWAIVRGVFRPSEIESFRNDTFASHRERLAGDLLSNSRLSRVLLDDRIFAICRALLGEQPTYFGDSSWYSSDIHAFALGFHKDNAYKFTQDGPDWNCKYPLLRMGIYLQDHVEHSGGIAIRDRSHITMDCSVGQPFAVPTAKGDVVVWSLRTSHSGFVSRPRLFPKAFLPMTVQNVVTVRAKTTYRPPTLFFRPLEYPSRLALFMSFGIDGKHLRRYVEYLKTRRYAVTLWKQSVYTESVRAELHRKGFGLVDSPAQVRNIDLSTTSEEHREPVGDLLLPPLRRGSDGQAQHAMMGDVESR